MHIYPALGIQGGSHRQQHRYLKQLNETGLQLAHRDHLIEY